MAVLESLLVILAVVVALMRPTIADRAFARMETVLRAVSRPQIAFLTVSLVAIAARALILPWAGEPSPRNGDDFSLILQAQTFLEGRLANPRLPLVEHFETRYVNQDPAYAAAFFPGRGLPLAAGLALTGHAWLGVWATVVLLSLAVVWMLRAVLPPAYALLGGILTVLRFGVFSLFINTYWGAAVTALGGVLVVGGFIRLMRQPRWLDAGLLGAGLFLLLTTRPFEGFLFCLPLGAGLLVRMVSRARAHDYAAVARTAALPMIFLAGGLFLLGAYNMATTGQITVTPYDTNRAAYAVAPAFLAQPPIVPARAAPGPVREFYQLEAAEHRRATTPLGLLRVAAAKLRTASMFYVGPLFVAPLLFGLAEVRRHRLLAAAAALMLLGYLSVTWDWPNYLTPMFGVVMLVVMAGFQRLRAWRWRGRPSGLFLSRVLPFVAASILIAPLSAVATGWPRVPSQESRDVCCALSQPSPRQRIAERLAREPGRDLVLVRQAAGRNVREVWVANGPDLDRAEIIWAHDLGPAKDAAVVARFPGRRVWRLDVPTRTVAEVSPTSPGPLPAQYAGP